MNCGIYLIINTINRLIYVGNSKDLRKRWAEHSRKLLLGKHDNSYLQRAWNKYKSQGCPAFIFSVVEYCEEGDLLDREDWWIDLLGTLDAKKGYNLVSAHRNVVSQRTKDKIAATLMGNVPWNKGKKGLQLAWNKGKQMGPQSAELIEKRAAAMRGHVASEETRAKIAAAHIGRSPSPEAAAKISAANKGRTPPNKGKPMSEAQRLRLSEIKRGQVPWNKGKPLPLSPRKGQTLSESHKQKLSDARKGKAWSAARREAYEKTKGTPLSAEHKEKISKALQGKPGKPSFRKGGSLTEEHRLKIAASHREYQARKRAQRAAETGNEISQA